MTTRQQGSGPLHGDPTARGVTRRQAPIYRLRITLRDIKPLIWRGLEIPSRVTLAQLHEIMQAAMPWHDSHLHRFVIDGAEYGTPYPDQDWSPDHDDRRYRLADVLQPGSVFAYEYDFGDSWIHDVFVEEGCPLDPKVIYPICVGGARACPPEDCGGPTGYDELLASLGSCTHDEYVEATAWVGGFFDPEGFDPNRINAALWDKFPGVTRPALSRKHHRPPAS